MNASIIFKYFPDLTDKQREQYEALAALYVDWNSKINVISRKDIDNLYEHHVLHSLGIAKVIQFRPETTVLDLGTGGGFPGIPLAIMFPDVHFHLIDSIGKKIRIVEDVVSKIGLENVTFSHRNAVEEKGMYDFVVSRAVMNLNDLERMIRKNIHSTQRNALPNGLLCLKGGDLTDELKNYRNSCETWSLDNYFDDEYYVGKHVVYLPIGSNGKNKKKK